MPSAKLTPEERQQLANRFRREDQDRLAELRAWWIRRICMLTFYQRGWKVNGQASPEGQMIGWKYRRNARGGVRERW